MKIKLARPWFSPEAFLLEQGTHDVPNSWKDKLPSSAKILDETEKPKPAPKKPIPGQVLKAD